jgi:hypothetical protein
MPGILDDGWLGFTRRGVHRVSVSQSPPGDEEGHGKGVFCGASLPFPLGWATRHGNIFDADMMLWNPILFSNGTACGQ